MKKYLFLALLLIAASVIWLTRGNDTAQTPHTHAQIRDLNIEIIAPGELIASDLVSVATLTNGEIKKLFIKQGDLLAKGDVIAVLDDEEQKNALEIARSKLSQLEDEKSAALARSEQANYKLLQAQKLHASGGASKDALIQAQVNAASAKAAQSAAASALASARVNIKTLEKSLADTVVRSPISGTAIAVYATAGQTINSRQSSPVLAKIADISTLEVKLRVSQHEISRLKIGQQVSFKPLASAHAPERCKLDAIDIADVSTVDARAGAVVEYYARCNIKANERLKIGMQVNANVLIRRLQGVLALPIAFVQSDARGYFVWVDAASGAAGAAKMPAGAAGGAVSGYINKDSGAKDGVAVDGAAGAAKMPADAKNFRRQSITLGENDGRFVQILSGLAPGEAVYLPSEEQLIAQQNSATDTAADTTTDTTAETAEIADETPQPPGGGAAVTDKKSSTQKSTQKSAQKSPADNSAAASSADKSAENSSSAK